MASKDQYRQLDTLVQIASLLTSLDVDEVLTQMIYLTSEAVSATKGSFILLDEQQRTVKRYLSARDMPPQAQQIAFAKVLSDGVAGWVVQNRKAALIADTEHDARWLMLEDGSRVRSALCVPFFISNEMRGVITLEHSEPNHFSGEDLRLVEATANQASASLQNAELFDRIQQQQQQLEIVLNSITDGLLVVDEHMRVELGNPAAWTLLGQDASAQVNPSLTDESVSNVFQKLAHELSTQPVADTYTFDLRDDQFQRDYVINATRLMYSSEKSSGYVIALHDVTTLKDLSRLKTHMIKMASHDLKNPLNVLIGYLDMIGNDAQAGILPDMSFIDNMHRVITRMLTMIASLLDSQKTDEGGLRRVAIDPYELVNTVLADMKPTVQQRNQQLNDNIALNLRPLRGDNVQLHEAMINLVSNASKYTPVGGTITIDARGEDERFYFNVTDTGYGIPAAMQPKIFQPYFRAVSEATKDIEGTGVGLSLVKEVIERHGGQVSFQSEEGVGSTFGFWLPVL